MPNDELISKELFNPIALSYEKLPEPNIIPKGFNFIIFFLSYCAKPDVIENKNKNAKDNVFNEFKFK